MKDNDYGIQENTEREEKTKNAKNQKLKLIKVRNLNSWILYLMVDETEPIVSTHFCQPTKMNNP